MFGSDIVTCTDGQATTLGYFDLSLAPDLLNYSYTTIAFVALFVGSYIFVQNRSSVLHKVLFLQTLTFALFIISEIIQWIVIPAGIVHFAYSISLLLQSLILLFTFYFVYLFVNQNDLSFKGKLFVFILLAPIITLLPSKLNLEGILLESCSGVTGILWNYFYSLEAFTAILFFTWGFFAYSKYKRNPSDQLLSSVYLLFASSVFLIIFLVSYLYADVTGVYEINLIGPIGKLLFIGMLAYLIVRFKAFDIKLLGTQVLVIALAALVASQYFYVEGTTAFALASITLGLVLGFGHFLIRSVQQEVAQREQIAKLAEDLKQVNERLKILDKMKSEFVSIASHQLRSPLTSIRGYTSMLIEGSYGKVPAKVAEVIENIGDSAKFMALSVEDYLNVSRIEAGNMKYELCNFDLKDTVSKVVDEQRSTAIKKGLILVFRSDLCDTCIVNADIGKTRQIIMNILDNAMKYTPKGTITVVMQQLEKKVRVTIQDTGVGMNKNTQNEVFEKFVRAKNANSVNVTGTGLGLYVARKMLSDMGGNIRAESEGEGMGSTFHIEFPLI